MILISSGLFANGVRLPVGGGAPAWVQRRGFKHTLFGGQDPVDQWMPAADIQWRITAIEVEDGGDGFTQENGEPIPMVFKANGKLTIDYQLAPTARAKGFVCIMRPGISPTGFLGQSQSGGSTAEYRQVKLSDWLFTYGESIGRQLERDTVPTFHGQMVPLFYAHNTAGDLLVAEGAQVQKVTDLKFQVMIGTEADTGVGAIGRRTLAEMLDERDIRQIGCGLPVKERSALEVQPRDGVYRLDGSLDGLRKSIHRHATTLIPHEV